MKTMTSAKASIEIEGDEWTLSTDLFRAFPACLTKEQGALVIARAVTSMANDVMRVATMSPEDVAAETAKLPAGLVQEGALDRKPHKAWDSVKVEG